jgi:hypothetical protein
MSKKSFGKYLALVVSCAFAIACDSHACHDEEGCEEDNNYDFDAALSPNCEPIKVRCHYLDRGNPGKIHDCHELSHEGTDEQCAAELAACLAACPLPDAGQAGAGNDGGS